MFELRLGSFFVVGGGRSGLGDAPALGRAGGMLARLGAIGLAVVALTACGKADSFCAGSGTSTSAGAVTCGATQLCVEADHIYDDGSSSDWTEASCKQLPSACENGGCTGGSNGSPTTECQTAVVALCGQAYPEARLSCSSAQNALLCLPGAP
jgi:hypothetical protein